MDFQHGHHQQQQQMNAGLTRYRSAPSSYFTSYLDATTNTISSCGGSGSGSGSGSGGGGIGGHGMDDLDHFLNRFLPNNAQGQESNPSNSFSINMSMQSQTPFVKQEQETIQPQQQPLKHQNNQNDYSEVSQMMYQSQASAQAEVQAQRNHISEAPNASAMDYSNRLLSSMNSNQFAPMKMATGGGNSNLIRYNSSPAGLFANINIENEYGAMTGMGNFGAVNNANAEASFSSASRFKGFSSGQSSSRLISPISEIETKGVGENNSSNRNFEEGRRNDGDYVTGFPVSSWDDSTMLSDNFLKGLGDDDNKTFSNVAASDNQASEGQNNAPPTLLSRHLSLPNTSVDLSSMETLMQDSVLCKIRAKRGCATHPRSIAERVRRTRISERMRKLQELVPNMEKQTNTSDMLDLAVDYIKDLQKQVKIIAQTVRAPMNEVVGQKKANR